MTTVNIRCLGASMSGVQRYTTEITRRFPSSWTAVGGRAGSGAVGHLWEQVVLPSLIGSTLLWSPANTGPVKFRNQVVTIHDCAVFAHPQFFHPRFAVLYRSLLPRLARDVRRVLSVSEFSKGEIVRYTGCDPDRISVVANGVDERFRRLDSAGVEEWKQRFGIVRPFVLCVGSIEPRKNLAFLAKVWEGARIGDFDLLIVGRKRANFADSLLPTGPSVRWLSDLKDEDLVAAYNAAHCFLYPAVYEGFGLPPLEALSCGTATIASLIPPISEARSSLIQESEFRRELFSLVPVNNLSDWIEELRSCCAKNSPVSTQEAVSRCVKRAFSWEQASTLTWNLLCEERRNMGFAIL